MTSATETVFFTLPTTRRKHSPEQFSRAWVVVLLLADMAMFALSAYVAGALVFHRLDAASIENKLLVSDLCFIALWIAVFWRLGLYKRSFALSMKDELYYTVSALAIGIAPQFLLFTLIPAISTSRAVLLLALGLSIVAVGVERSIVHLLRDASVKGRTRRVALIGSADRLAVAEESLDLHGSTERLRVVVDDLDATLSEDGALLGAADLPWLRSAVAWGCDTVVLTEMLPPALVPAVLEYTRNLHVSLAFAPPRFCCHAYKLALQTDGHQTLLVPVPLRACTPSALLSKRIFDVAVSALILCLVAPVMALAALALWLESGGPILYRQQRVGRAGKTFNLLKFRSMVVDAEAQSGPVWAKHRDGRITRVGAFLRRFSIDELPQFMNVLRGDMSIVGPRPERPTFVALFRQEHARYDERHVVRPGITGWSQVHMARLLDERQVGEKLSHDLFYIEHWSLFMDISVVLKTAAEFLFHKAV